LLASGELLGVLQDDPEHWFAGASGNALSGEAVEELLRERDAARAARNFAQADAIRERLGAAGIAIEDGPSGTRWRRTG